jgi:hypothetical protein
MVRFARATILLVIIFLLAGCTITHNLKPAPQPGAWPETTKTPFHAGVYYSPQFAEQEYVRSVGSNVFVAWIGASSVQLFDELLPRVFEKATHVLTVSGEHLNAEGINVVVVPSLEHFDFRVGAFSSEGDFQSVIYRTTLYSTRGVPVASWLVLGNAEKRSKTMWTNQSLIEDDMNDAAVNFLQGFERHAGPALAAIAKTRKVKPFPSIRAAWCLMSGKPRYPGLIRSRQQCCSKPG